MYCPNCGFNLTEDQVFCPNCGKFVVKEGAFSPSTSNYPPTAMGRSGNSEINSNWSNLIVFLSIGWLTVATDFIVFSWRWYFGFDINYLTIRFIVLIIFLLSAVFGYLLSKLAINKTKMLIGYCLVAIGLIVEFISASFILSIIGLLLIFTGVSCLLSSLPKNGKLHLWTYPIAGVIGAILASFIISPLNERFGGRVIPLLTVILIIILGVVMAFLYQKESPTGKTYTIKQWLFVIGTVLIIFASFYIIEIFQRLIRGLPIF